MLDSHAPDAFALRTFGDLATWRIGNLQPIAKLPIHEIANCTYPVLRRFRLPVVARVVMAADRPARVTTDRVGIKGGDVQQCAGPWRSSGQWWSAGGSQGTCAQLGECRSEEFCRVDRDERRRGEPRRKWFQKDP
jgi:hypothetical protein